MKLQFRNDYYTSAIRFKQMLHKILKFITGNDNDPFGNSCVIL